MFLETTLKIFSDCCVMFAILGCCPSLLPYSYPLALSAAVCALAAGIAGYFREKFFGGWFRLCILLLPLALFPVKSAAEAAILVPAILYTGAVILRGRMDLDYFRFRQYFKRSLVLLAVLWGAASLCNYIEDPQGLKEMLVQPVNILRYAIAHFICGVALQRQLRLGRQKDSRGQVVAMMGGTGAVIAGFVAAEPLLRQNAIELMKILFTIAMIPAAAVYEAVVYIITAMMKDMTSSERYQEAMQDAAGRGAGTKYNDYQELMKSLTENAPSGEEFQSAMIILAVGWILALVLMFFVFGRKHVKQNVLLSAETATAKRRREPVIALNPRARVRQMYRDFLKREKLRGVKIRKDCTTAEILQNLSRDANRAPAAELREIYLHARYDETREVSRAEAEAAKAALRQIHEK